MKTDNSWLNEMMDAALTDSPEAVKAPGFEAIRQASPQTRYHSPFRHRRLLIAAAAAVLAVGIALPVGIIAGRRVETRGVINEQNTLFVEELIGGTIFDEGLDADGFWLFDDTGYGNSIDI